MESIRAWEQDAHYLSIKSDAGVFTRVPCRARWSSESRITCQHHLGWRWKLLPDITPWNYSRHIQLGGDPGADREDAGGLSCPTWTVDASGFPLWEPGVAGERMGSWPTLLNPLRLYLGAGYAFKKGWMEKWMNLHTARRDQRQNTWTEVLYAWYSHYKTEMKKANGMVTAQ